MMFSMTYKNRVSTYTYTMPYSPFWQNSTLTRSEQVVRSNDLCDREYYLWRIKLHIRALRYCCTKQTFIYYTGLRSDVKARVSHCYYKSVVLSDGPQLCIILRIRRSDCYFITVGRRWNLYSQNNLSNIESKGKSSILNDRTTCWQLMNKWQWVY